METRDPAASSTMLLTTLPILLAFPSTILSFLVIPDIISARVLRSDSELPGLSRPRYCGPCYAAPAPPDAVTPGCCNTCAEVRRAYKLKGWKSAQGRSFRQCQREGLGELREAQQHEGVPHYTTSNPPPAAATATRTAQDDDQEDEEQARQHVLSFKYAMDPQTVVEEEVVDDDWVRITRLSPKFASPPLETGVEDEEVADDPLPVVIWHGLGDSADADGLKDVAQLIDEIHPGTYTYLIAPNGKAGSADRQASFFGNVTEQLESVCHALAHDNILRTAPAIDAVGFSQGGQFLRGYIERCGSWAPKVRSLITFGSQHNGIAEFQKCASPTDWVCQGANAILKSSTVWSDFAQSRLVPAQYYRPIDDYDNYLEHSNFLADINNERLLKNTTYADNLAALEKFVMVLFRADRTVIPKESGWFAEVNTTAATVTKLRDRPIYKDDWIGLKRLDEKNGLDFLAVDGEHMQLKTKDLEKLFGTYFGPFGKEFGASPDLEMEMVEEEEQQEQDEEKFEL